MANASVGRAQPPIELRIIGMSCGACVSRVEAALRRVPGADDAVVNLMTESAVVRGATQPPGSDDLVRAVRAAGYDAEPMRGLGAAANDADVDADQHARLRQQRQSVINAVMYALPILALDHFGHALQSSHAAGQVPWRIIQAALLIMLMLSPAGGPLLAGGMRAALHRAPNMDLLITLGVMAAAISSVAGTLTVREDLIHYHAAAMILLLVAVGRYLEVRARGRAGSALAALARRAAGRARVRRDGQWRETPIAEVRIGDELSVEPGETIPTDGSVLEGDAIIDESLMTGEPIPVSRGAGGSLLGGTVVRDGRLIYRATRRGGESALARIVDLVRRAQATHTPLQRLADRTAAIFTPIVLLLSLATLAGWLILHGPARLPEALSAAVAVLVVACPCAMGLATPTAVLVATGQAALRGILVRDAAALEALGRVTHLFWDKTGTLTAGRPQFHAMQPVAIDENELLRLAASAEQFAVHPLAGAIVSEARRRELTLLDPESFHSTPGAGVEARLDGRIVRVGSESFCSAASALAALRDAGRESASAPAGEPPADVNRRTPQSPPALLNRDQMLPINHAAGLHVHVAIDGRYAGRLRFDDPPRPSAAAAVRRAAALGIRQTVLTGDTQAAAAALVELLECEAGVGVGPVGNHGPGDRAAVSPAVVGGASPVQKLAAIRAARGPERVVAMVGDGVNDAAALAAADVGIAFATGADAAQAAAAIQLVGATPLLVADAVDLARRCTRIIRQNLFWAFAYNALMLPAAAVGRLDPGWAAGAMMLSSLTVLLNALRLRGR